MKKIFIFLFFLLSLNANAMEKETTFSKELFDKAQSDGKIVIVSSWIKYCTSCASQMKVLNKAKNEFDNIEYFIPNYGYLLMVDSRYVDIDDNKSGKTQYKIISENMYYQDDDEEVDGEKSAVFELYKLDKETKRYEIKEINDSDSNEDKGIL